MREKGITYLEIIIALSIFSIIAAALFRFYISNVKSYFRISCDIDEEVNSRIALEYLIDIILNSEKIGLVKVDGGKEFFMDEIKIDDEDGVVEPVKYLLAGNNKIYVVNKIIRCNQKSNHVVSGIESFSIKRKEERLYTLTVKAKNILIQTNVYKRK